MGEWAGERWRWLKHNHIIHVNKRCRRKKERSKQGHIIIIQTTKQSEATQHTHSIHFSKDSITHLLTRTFAHFTHLQWQRAVEDRVATAYSQTILLSIRTPFAPPCSRWTSWYPHVKTLKVTGNTSSVSCHSTSWGCWSRWLP